MPTGADAGDATLLAGRAIWINRCARCHGPAGKGGAGPRLAGRVVSAYPDAAAEVAVVTNGKGSGMPAWKSVLSDSDIAAVVEYTRRVL
jgi:cytochrome c oxidase subunit 2